MLPRSQTNLHHMCLKFPTNQYSEIQNLLLWSQFIVLMPKMAILLEITLKLIKWETSQKSHPHRLVINTTPGLQPRRRWKNMSNKLILPSPPTRQVPGHQYKTTNMASTLWHTTTKSHAEGLIVGTLAHSMPKTFTLPAMQIGDSTKMIPTTMTSYRILL